MSETALTSLTLAQAAEGIRSGAVSPVDLTGAYLDRIAALDGRFKAFLTVFGDQAMAAARAAEGEIQAGRYRGPLHGVPYAIKDLVYTREGATTAGSKVLADFRPGFDAAVIERLNQAGAIALGKTALHEFAYGPTGVNPHYGTPRNPWGADRIPGGSSSGSAVAVSAALIPWAIGSDTGGSIRIPAALCGVVGLKPTYGRVSRFGVLGLSWSMDHVGPLARTVEDAALALSAMAGYDARDPASADQPVPDFVRGIGDVVRGLRVGVVRDYFFRNLDPEVAAAVEAAATVLAKAGATVSEVAFPLAAHSSVINQPVMLSEAATYHQGLLRKHWDMYSPMVRGRLTPGFAVTATMYLNGQRARALLTRQALDLLSQVDVLLTPTEPVGAPRIGDDTLNIEGRTEGVVNAMTRLTRPFNLTGLPAVSLPCGFTSEGLPIGLQLAGRPWDEATVLRAAHAFEQATDWHTRRPSE
ncbi:MAG: amidase [Dehalococcoidia bacterium]|nr:amidase [Dehalococcoidia bacterium]